MTARRPDTRIVLALALVSSLGGGALVVLLAGSPLVAGAQDHATGRGGNAAPGGDDADNAAGDSASAEARAEERAEAGEKVKVFRFSGFDINGRLKSPSLLYFLNRLRAEFDHPRLPHRSFMPELERETAQSKALK